VLTAKAEGGEDHEIGYLLLSLFAPATTDRVDWSRGSYTLLRRSGRTHERGELKIESNLVEEGSVLISESAPVGFARNVAPANYDHPVYRAGYAVTIPVAVRLPSFHPLERQLTEESPVEDATSAPEAVPQGEIFSAETETMSDDNPPPLDTPEEAVEDSLAVPEVLDEPSTDEAPREEAP
jgi:hypothetical protein